MERSVERLEGVSNATVDLNTGQTYVWFEKGKRVETPALRKAVSEAGFTPGRVERQTNPDAHLTP